MPKSQFVEMYADDIKSLVGNVEPKTGRRIDWREDAGESAFLERQLEHIESRIYKYRLRELKFRRVFPVSNEGTGAEFIAYDLVRNTGIAKIIGSGVHDLPRADTLVTRHYAVVRSVGISFGYTTQELRHAAFSNVPLEERRGTAARRGMEEKLSDMAWNGDSEYNIIGILDNPNIPSTQAISPASGSDRTWAGGDKTPLEIIKDITDAIGRVHNRTKQIHMVNTVLLPINQMEYIRRTPYSEYVSHSILRYLKDPQNSFDLDMIEAVPELEDSGRSPASSTDDQMLVYERSEDVLTFRIPMELRALPPEQRNTSFLINMETECAGMVVRYPLACEFVYGI